MTASCRKLVSLVPPNGLHQDVARKIKLSGKSLSALKSLKNKIPRIVLLAFRQAFCYPNINLHFAFLSEHRFLERLSSTVRLIEGKGKRRLGDLNSFFSEIGHRKERLQINAEGISREEGRMRGCIYSIDFFLPKDRRQRHLFISTYPIL